MGTRVTQKLFSPWIYGHTTHSRATGRMIEDNKDGFSITPMIWKVRRTGIWRERIYRKKKKYHKPEEQKKDDNVWIEQVV